MDVALQIQTPRKSRRFLQRSLQAELLSESAGLQDPGVWGRRNRWLDSRRHRYHVWDGALLKDDVSFNTFIST